MRQVKAVIFAVILLAGAVPAFSYPAGGVDVEVVSDLGNTFLSIPHREYAAGSTRIFKRYLEARKGENYSLVIRNNLPQRVGVVIAVDGRNIITGKKSGLGSHERMYIVGPYGSARLEGWRTDRETVHRFFFTGDSDSYAVRAFGDASAMGVIAVAVFREKEGPALLHEQERAAGKAPAAPSAPQKEAKRSMGDSAGTGFGDERHSPVVKVEFEPEMVPAEKILLKYEWRDELCRKGILRCRQEVRNRLWEDDEYAPFPPGYSPR